MGHIRLSREADLVVVAPATADLIAKMAHGLADDLASTALLATDKPVLIAPAMNPGCGSIRRPGATWPSSAPMASDWSGPTRATWRAARPASGAWRSPTRSWRRSRRCWRRPTRPLAGVRALVTSGPTRRGDRPGTLHRQPLVGQAGPRDRRGARGGRRRGHPGQRAGARAGSAGRDAWCGSNRRQAMLAACRAALPVEVAVCAAAVADWRVAAAGGAQAQEAGRRPPPTLVLAENPDILKSLARPGPGAPGAGGRLRGGDRGSGAQRAAQAGSQGLRLDRRQ